ncbi:TPR-like protein [Wilcoxina mikolae CBS 423.85]|nr:TPR-like protein [Wilcoxina mikolae CBS 423.85]
MVPFSRNTRFIARSNKLAYLRNKLEGDESGGHRRLALWGLGGVGKTQNVLDFIYEFKGSQVSVFWVHAGSTTRFEQDYRKLAELLELPGHCDPKQDIRPVVNDWFERPKSDDWILVLDNADNKLDFFPESSDGTQGLVQFIPHGSKVTVIITTRDREVGDRLADMNVVHCEAMNMEEAKELFQLHYPKAVDQDHESISALLEGLQFLPLAIVHVAAYLRHNSAFLSSSYLMQFNSTRAKQRLLLSKPHKDIRRDSGNAETVLMTFSITFVQVQEQSPLAGNLLKLMACVDRQGISHDLLAQSGLEGSDEEVTLCEALSKLANFSLLTHAGSGGHSTYEIHSLVHLSIETFLSLQGEMEASIKQTAELLVGILPNGDSENWPVWRVYLPHASVFKSVCGQEHRDTLISMVNLASTYRCQGWWKEAEELGVLVTEMSKRVQGQEHPETLISMNLALTYEHQGQWKEVEALQLQVLEARKRVLGNERPNTLISINNLASTYEKQGRLKDEVEVLQLQLLEAKRRVLDQEHPGTLATMVNLASIYKSQGRWKEAEVLQLQAIEVMRRKLGQEHPDTLISMSSLASTYRWQGRWKESEVLHLQVLDTMRRTLGQEHPSTLTSMNNLASTYRG